MDQSFSKQNQISEEAAFRFGDFELYPRERVLRQLGAPVALQPKAFDALLCLVSKAERLITKAELTESLWPAVHVNEANLTNIVGALRKVLGRDAIRTISKHGYRFEMPVTGEPNVPREMYERFARAKVLTAHRSLQSMEQARDLLWICIAEFPSFAPAWAWLGRCSYFLGKIGDGSALNVDLADRAIQRALEIDPDLACAHQFYTLVQVDKGLADAAMRRLLERLRRCPAEPETFASLVQVYRFQGLHAESMEAHRQAVELDPASVTSVAHTRFLCGDYAGAIESYSGRGAFYLDAAAWAALGEHGRAIALVRERLGSMSLSKLLIALMSSLRGVLEDQPDAALHWMRSADATREPEVLVYFARHYARLGMPELAVDALASAAAGGFVCSPDALNADPWLAGLRGHASFDRLVSKADSYVSQRRETIISAARSS